MKRFHTNYAQVSAWMKRTGINPEDYFQLIANMLRVGFTPMQVCSEINRRHNHRKMVEKLETPEAA